MAFNKRTWVGRLGEGLNKYIIGALGLDGKQTITSAPDNVTQEGDALSASNLNDLETRIDNEFTNVNTDINKLKDGTTVAKKAECDEDGNTITTTYATKTELTAEATARQTADTVLQSEINQHGSRLQNLEQKAGDYGTWHYPNDPDHSSDMPNKVPTGKAKYGLVKSIVGKTRARNQLSKILSDSSTLGAWRQFNYSSVISADTSTNTISVKSAGSYQRDAFCRLSASGTFTQHTLLLSMKLKNNYTDRSILARLYKLGNGVGSIITSITLPANSTYYFSYIVNTDNSLDIELLGFEFFDQSGLGVDTTIAIDIIEPVIRDINIIFPDLPSTDLVTSNIPNLVKRCPDLLIFDEYGYSMVDTVVEGVESTSINIWNEDWFNGYYSTATGARIPEASNLCSKDLIPVEPNTSYHIIKGASNVAVVLCYDIGKNYLGTYFSNTVLSNNNDFSTPATCYYLSFYTTDTTYHNDIQICKASESEKNIYHPHVLDTLSLSTPVTLKSAGSVAEVLDVQTGKKTRPLKTVNMSTDMEWSYNSVYGVYISQTLASEIKIPASTSTVPDAMSDKYLAVAQNSSESGDRFIVLANGHVWLYKPNDGNNPSGMLTYALATPLADEQVCDPIIDNYIEVEGGGTIDTIQTQSPVIDNCLDVGYLAA